MAPFQAKISRLPTLGQIILFLLKIHHFRTYFLYMIRYNNISRPVHDPPSTSRTLCPKSEGVTTPKPPGLTPLIVLSCFAIGLHALTQKLCLNYFDNNLIRTRFAFSE